MDSFKEQIVRKIPTKNDKIQKIFIMIASVALAALCFIFPFGTQFSVIGIFLAAAALYGGYYLTTKLDVEYEYIFTNGEIDVDKITAQRSLCCEECRTYTLPAEHKHEALTFQLLQAG